MWGLIFLLIVVVAILTVMLLPRLKGFRTVIIGHLTWVIGAAVPLLTEIAGYLQGLDWRSYILSSDDSRNLIVLAIIAGLGVLMVILRHITTTPVGKQ